MDIVGRLLGLVIAGGLGGAIVALLGGPNLWLIGVIVGLALAFGIVRVLMNEPSLHGVLRWLYPYEGWTGTKD